MVNSSMRELTITLPDSVVTDLGLGTPIVRLAILEDGKIQGGKRAIERSYRDANASDAGRIRRVAWELWGEIGHSLYSSSQRLGIDFAQNLETRWERRLISRILQNSVDLTGFDPPGTGSYFGTAIFGSSYFGSGASSGADGVCFDEQLGYLFAHRGPVSTQVSLSDWSVVDSVTHNANVRWADDWYGFGRLAMGPAQPIQTRTGVTSSGATYSDTTATSPSGLVYASYVRVGSDRAWYIDAATGTEFNFAGFTLDGFANLASPFQVGDPFSGVNGIGPFGPVTSFGSERGTYSFTDQGKPVPLSKALETLGSPVNGQQFCDPGWGWNYYISITGLRAHDLRGNDNPIGIGERMRAFTGHNGIPTAIFATRGELWVVYQDSTGNLWGYRGVFGPETGGTGQPLFFPWFYEASQTCNAITASSTPNSGTQNLTVIRYAGTNLTYETIAANGRDDLANLSYSTAGGTAYFTTLDKDPNLLKTLRIARVKARGMQSGDSWAVAMGFDPDPIDPIGSTYVTVGTVTADGQQTLQPASAGVPLTSISGTTIKPRITQVALAYVTNYVTNPSFEAPSTTGWTFASGTTGSAETTQARYGDYSCRLQSDVPAGSFTASTAITLEPNTTYYAGLSVLVPSSTLGPTSGGTISITGLTGATGSLTANYALNVYGTWQDITIGPFTTGSDVTGTLTVTGSGSPSRVIYIDGAFIVNGDYGFFDGSSTGCTWNGTANASTSRFYVGTDTPPELDGMLEIEYDERPEQIEEINVAVSVEGSNLSQNTLWTVLQYITGSQTDGPFKIQLPDDLTPGVAAISGGGQKYAMVNSVTRRTDVKDDALEAVTVALTTWPQGSPLS